MANLKKYFNLIFHENFFTRFLGFSNTVNFRPKIRNFYDQAPDFIKRTFPKKPQQMFTSAISEFHYCISFLFLYHDKAGCLLSWNSLSKFPYRFFSRCGGNSFADVHHIFIYSSFFLQLTHKNKKFQFHMGLGRGMRISLDFILFLPNMWIRMCKNSRSLRA